MNDKVKYKKFNKYADEIKNTFSSWLEASGLDLDTFKSKLNSDTFELAYIERDNLVRCVMYSDGEIIGIPFESQSASKTDIDNFKTDLMLILFHVSSFGNDDKIYDYIKNFITENKLN